MAFQQVSVQQQGGNPAAAQNKAPPVRQDMNADGTEQTQIMAAKLCLTMACPPFCCPITSCAVAMDPPGQKVTEMDVQRRRMADKVLAEENVKPGTVIVAEDRIEILGLDFAFNPAAPIGALPGGMPMAVYQQILQDVYDEVYMKTSIGQQKLTDYAQVSEERLRGRRSTQQHAFQQLAERYAAQGIELRLDWCPMQAYLTKYKIYTRMARPMLPSLTRKTLLLTLREPTTLHIVIRGVSQGQVAMPQSPPTYVA